MLHACVERFDVMGGRENILSWDGEVNKAELGLTDGLSAVVLQDAAKPEQLAAAEKLFARREARWRELTTRLTLLGYAPPPAAGHGDGSGNAN
jgi:hypothetical protein